MEDPAVSLLALTTVIFLIVEATAASGTRIGWWRQWR
jgi:hypothetical protein